jgi:hypothetical protein
MPPFVRNCIEAVTSQTVTPIKHGSKVKSQVTPYNPVYDDSLVREDGSFVPCEKLQAPYDTCVVMI